MTIHSTQSGHHLPRWGGAVLAAAFIAAAPFHSLAQDTPAAPPAPRPAVPVITPQGGLPERQPKVPTPPQPVPDSGANPAFSFQRAGDDDGTFMVNSADGSAPVRVSESFLGLIMRNPQITDEQRNKVLQSYPTLIEKQFDAAMNQMFPDASQTGEAQPFQPQTIGTPGGAEGSVSVESDPEAPGYVRVSLATPDGQVLEFSAAQGAVEQMLANQSMTPEQKIQGLKNFPFKLPENARQNFKDLSREELLELASQTPDLQDQEFVKMKRYYAKETAGDDGTTPTENQDPEPGVLETTIVERLPRQTPPPPPSAPVETPDSREEPVRSETASTARDGETDTTVTRASTGITGTTLVAIAVVAIGLITAAALVLRRRKQ